eukprot:gene12235-biopygen1898
MRLISWLVVVGGGGGGGRRTEHGHIHSLESNCWEKRLRTRPGFFKFCRVGRARDTSVSPCTVAVVALAPPPPPALLGRLRKNLPERHGQKKLTVCLGKNGHEWKTTGSTICLFAPRISGGTLTFFLIGTMLKKGRVGWSYMNASPPPGEKSGPAPRGID